MFLAGAQQLCCVDLWDRVIFSHAKCVPDLRGHLKVFKVIFISVM